ncbi:MAG: hypothetical protein QM790_10565 [Nibricoccus sp.]
MATTVCELALCRWQVDKDGVITPSGWMTVLTKNVLKALGLLFAAWMLSVSAFAAPQWHFLETPRFTVVSQISERETRNWANKFNQFIDEMGGIVRFDEKYLPKLTIVIFGRNKDFAPYRPLGKDGKAQDWVAGVFSRQDCWGVIGLAEDAEDEAMRRLVYHECVHWLVSAYDRVFPKWFDEGLAELFSTLEVEKGQIVIGKPIESHVVLLRGESPLPIQKLLLVSSSDPLFNETDRTGIFYAESWAFVHYLMCGDKKGKRGTIGDFLNAFYSNASVEEAFRSVFGMDYGEMDKALREYLRQGRYFMAKRPLPDTKPITAPFQLAPPAFVEVALARLAYGTGRTETAEKHVGSALRIDPNYAPGYVMKAWGLQYGDGVDQFLESAEKAAQLGASDSEVLYLLAQAKFKKAHTLGGIPPKEAREIAGLLERAIDGLPSLKYAYVNLASVLGWVEKLNQNDVNHVVQGRKLYPDEMAIVIGWIYVLRNQGYKEKAVKMLGETLSVAEKLNADQLKQLRSLRMAWDVNDTQQQASQLIEARRYKEAVEILDGLAKRGIPVEARGYVAQQRGNALAFATFDEADAARKEGRVDEARKLYESLLTMKAAPPFLREKAKTHLAGPPKGNPEPTDSEQ